MESDITIRENVIDELDFDPAIIASGIGVAVKNGVVTLSGHVASYAEKYAATRATQRVKGVRAVAQEVEVRLSAIAKRADDEIAQRALNILTWSSARTDKVKVLVDNGWVTLSGDVPWHFLKNAAEQSVRQLSGVSVVKTFGTDGGVI